MTSLKQIWNRSRHILFYGVCMAMMVFAMKWLQWKYLITDYSLDIYVGLLAVFFTLLGIWVATQLAKPKIQTIIVEKVVYLSPEDVFTINEAERKRLNLSSREYEVLQLLAQGYSNSKIADQVCLSLSTVKTHVSNLLVKMDVKNRTQAAEKAKRLKIIS